MAELEPQMSGGDHAPRNYTPADGSGQFSPAGGELDPTQAAARGQSSELASLGEEAAPQVSEPPPVDQFQAALAECSWSQARSVWPALTPQEQARFAHDPAQLEHIARATSLAEGVVVFGWMGLDVFDVYTSVAEDVLAQAFNQNDPAAVALLHAQPDRVAWCKPPRLSPQYFVDLLVQLGVPAQDQLAHTGLFGGTPDWDLFMEMVTTFTQADRQLALEEVRAQQKWEVLLAALTEAHVVMVQGWLDQDSGDGTGQTLEERIAAAHNSARANVALATVDGVRGIDFENRITDRLRELLVLGVALPKLAGEAQSEEGVLSPAQVERACRALIWMPQVEYLRLSMLLELTGDASRLTQSFLLLEATAARADDYGMMQRLTGTSGNLGALEGFADATRGMDEQTVVEQTSVTQTRAGAGDGMIQKFSDSCGPTSAQVIRAEADPVEALRMRQGGELAQDALDTDAAREQEGALERHYGQVAVPRSAADITAAVTAALRPARLSGAQRRAVTRYLANQAFTQADFDAALPKLERHMAASYPGADGLRMVREGQAGTGASAGLLPSDQAVEANGALDIDTRTGLPLQDLFDNSLWNLFVAAGKQINAVNMTAWNANVTALLDQAAPKLERGEDVTFIIYWNGSGGHFMAFTNVRTEAGAREFLVHDPWTGQTEWVTQANVLAGTWPGGTALICGLQG